MRELKVFVALYENELVCIKINSNSNDRDVNPKEEISCVVLFLYQRHLKSIYLELQILCV